MQSLLISSLLVGASALNIPAAALSRRAAVNAGAAALAGLAPFAATAAAKVPEKESKLVKSTAAELKTVLENKESFITDLANGVEGSGKLPAPIPFTTFQKLEATADPEFMEAAIDYAEGAPPHGGQKLSARGQQQQQQQQQRRRRRRRHGARILLRVAITCCPCVFLVPALRSAPLLHRLTTTKPLLPPRRACSAARLLRCSPARACSVPRRQGPGQAGKARKVEGDGDHKGGRKAHGKR